MAERGGDRVSVFERALGADWDELHPRLRERYGVAPDEDRQVVGRGTMRSVSLRKRGWPVAQLLALDDALVPSGGTDVPVTITTTPFVDANGYGALFAHRQFNVDRQHVFVDTLRWNPGRECITVFVGWRGLFAVDAHLEVTNGALGLTFGEQWLRVGAKYVPIPSPLAAEVRLRDWYDDDRECYRIEASASNSIIGWFFGYHGQFENTIREAVDEAFVFAGHSHTSLPGGQTP